MLENESQSFELGGIGFDALFDYYADELLQEGSYEGGVPSESPSDAGPVHQEDELSSVADGGGGGSGEKAEESGTEEAESSDGRGSSGGEGESESVSSSGGRFLEGTETEASERESSRGESAGGESAGKESPEREEVSGTGESSFRESSEEYPESLTAETLVPQEELQQIHSDLQFISCFMVVFLVMAVCHYAYRFFKIFI